MLYSRIILFIIIANAIFFASCDNMFSTDDEELVANAGADQTTIVGSYVIIDAGKSSGAIDWYEWEQDGRNPDEVRIYSNSNDPIQMVGFIKEGIYKFRLTVMSGSQFRNSINLKYVRLWDNQITDIKPLIDNPGIGTGDIVGLNGNPLDEKSINEYIPILLERKVYVTW
jgi:hypothetical protein